jgi:hypothetical protein
MTELFARQGISDWTEYADSKQMRRNKNVVAAREVLTRNHIDFKEQYGRWFRIEEAEHRIDYQPETGIWTDYGIKPHHKGYGIRNLVRHLRGKVD